MRLATISALLYIILYSGSAAADQEIQHNTMSADAQTLLLEAIQSDARSEAHKARDQYRHPFETLGFFGLEPDMTVVEIWPGGQGGWYRKILSPFLENRGRYIPVTSRSDFPDHVDDLPYGEVDMVLVFRAHGFLIYREPAQQHVDALFQMVRPGGIMAIVDHAGDEAIPQDPDGRNGYINESHFRMMAERAGFVLLAESDINRNPADTKDHPRGVYSLPPSLSGSRRDRELRAQMQDIGESDRFTLVFYKPLDD